MAAMENAANVDDFSEYKHKDNLIEQVKYVTQNFTVLVTPQPCFAKSHFQLDLPFTNDFVIKIAYRLIIKS